MTWQIRSERTFPFPLKLYKPGSEWLVELQWPVQSDGELATCGLFASKDEATARSFYDNAHRILSCWYVAMVWSYEEALGPLAVLVNLPPKPSTEAPDASVDGSGNGK